MKLLLPTTGRALAVALLAVALLAVALGSTSGGASAAVGDCVPAAAWPAAQPAAAATVIADVNAYRAGRGLPQLRVSASLTASATWKARHMAAFNYMAHDDPAPPVARTFLDRFAACGVTGSAGEIIARWYASPAEVVQAWLADPPHRAAIEGGWSSTGVAVAVSSAGIPYWAEDFSTAAGSAPPPPPPPPPPANPPSPSPPPPPPGPPAPAPAAPTGTPAGTPAPAAAPGAGGTQARRLCVVPRVSRLRASVAVRALRRASCGVRTIRVYTPRVSAGRVAWQSPRRRVRVPAGSAVTIAVSAAR